MSNRKNPVAEFRKMSSKESVQNNARAFDPRQLLEMGKDSPALRHALMDVIRNVVERTPRQFRDARLAWEDGRTEDATRLLHTIRGTIGTMGATRFAEMARNLESAVQARQEKQVTELFGATQLCLNETIAEATAFLAAECPPVVEDKEALAASVFKSARARPDLGDKADQGLADWYEKTLSDIKDITNEIRQLKQEMTRMVVGQIPPTEPAVSPTCLVVEDDELIAHLLVHLLSREGYAVTHAGDGRTALEAISKAASPPDLILLDVMLPYVDGYELLRVIRDQKRWTDVSIIMLTAKQQENDIVRALDAGATDYVVKPFQPNELMARLRRNVRLKGKK